MEAESIRTALSVGRIRSLQVVAGSPAIFAAIAFVATSEPAATSKAS
jgi:poly(3-hydroxybutyrate) depolymerase